MTFISSKLKFNPGFTVCFTQRCHFFAGPNFIPMLLYHMAPQVEFELITIQLFGSGLFQMIKKYFFFGGTFKYLMDSSLKGRLSYINTPLVFPQEKTEKYESRHAGMIPCFIRFVAKTKISRFRNPEFRRTIRFLYQNLEFNFILYGEFSGTKFFPDKGNNY